MLLSCVVGNVGSHLVTIVTKGQPSSVLILIYICFFICLFICLSQFPQRYGVLMLNH